MEIKSIILRRVKMELLNPFTKSVGTELDKDFILVEVKLKSGLSGWAESVSIKEPIYDEETVKTNWHIMSDHLIPSYLQKISGTRMMFRKLSGLLGGISMLTRLETGYHRS